MCTYNIDRSHRYICSEQSIENLMFAGPSGRSTEAIGSLEPHRKVSGQIRGVGAVKIAMPLFWP